MISTPSGSQVLLQCIVEVSPKPLNGWYRNEGKLRKFLAPIFVGALVVLVLDDAFGCLAFVFGGLHRTHDRVIRSFIYESAVPKIPKT